MAVVEIEVVDAEPLSVTTGRSHRAPSGLTSTADISGLAHRQLTATAERRSSALRERA
jgi:hypothetical protein